MRKVLIVGYLWPYCRFKGGSPRTLGLANYLEEFGWEPIVLTAPLDGNSNPELKAEIIESSNRDIFHLWRKLFLLSGFRNNKSISGQLKEKIGITSKKSFIDVLLSYYMTLFAYPDADKHWRSFAIKSANDIFRKVKINEIISTWPITAHLVAKELKSEYKVPWIADFSHLWSQGYNYQYGNLRKFMDRKLELKTLSNADALTTISTYFVDKLRELHLKKPIYSITHGFNPSLINAPAAPLTKQFTITYTGNIYPIKQKPSKLFESLRELMDNNIIDRKDIEVSFYGGRYGWLEKESEYYGVSDVVHQHDFIAQPLSVQKQRESQILLHLGWDDDEIKGFYSSKIFEYLAAQRPILAVGGASDEVVNDLILETKAGLYSKEVKDIKEFIKKFYLEYKKNGKVSYTGDIEKINKYSHREMARKFADIMNELMNHK
jgi:glycosyltransferase involved in cell wall biosynthesis